MKISDNYMLLEAFYIRFNSCSRDISEHTLIPALHLDHE